MAESDEKTVDGVTTTKVDQGDIAYVARLFDRGEISSGLRDAILESVEETYLHVRLGVPAEITPDQIPIAETVIRYMADYDRPERSRVIFVDANLPNELVPEFLTRFTDDPLTYKFSSDYETDPVRDKTTGEYGFMAGVGDIQWDGSDHAKAEGSYYFDGEWSGGVSLTLARETGAWHITKADLHFIS